ncbi:hypothetical protein EV715DRAFT_184470, partial [Schizophyllum commune]
RSEKKRRQWKAWGVLLPALVEEYRAHVYHRDVDAASFEPADACICGGTKPKQEVKCLYLDRIEGMKICTCNMAVQLMRHGLFPCAPIRPSLAVDLQLLEFTRLLFSRLPPSITAICEALQDFLAPRGYRLETWDTLRRRFSVCLYWYAVVEQEQQAQIIRLVDQKIHLHRQQAAGQAAQVLPTAMPSLQLPTPSPSISSATSQASSSRESTPTAGTASSRESTPTVGEDGDLDAPSDYLRRRCPCCFGGQGNNQTVGGDFIVCIDACFTQKRRSDSASTSGDHGPPNAYLQSFFLPEERVQAAKDLVERVRGAPNPRSATDTGEFCIYCKKYNIIIRLGTPLPAHVLDSCQESFVAADEKRVKASTQLFSDTGLMAMLCRHDRLLWQVNMTTAGESQYYAIALVQKLFEELPQHATVGLLYDIACQLHRSCVKWGLLSQYLPRLRFAVSVFHAYGHQWACQLIYHPRKREGFGLSDGEGCERFWNAIKLLIPSLRVSGYFQRLFALDRQVEFLDARSTKLLGNKMQIMYFRAHERRSEALGSLTASGLEIIYLRQQFKEQVKEQTRPLASSDGRRVLKEAHSILELEERLRLALDQQATFGIFSATAVDAGDLLSMDMDEYNEKIKVLAQKISQERKKLGGAAKEDLARIQNSEYLRLNMQLHAVKERIRFRLRERKFELERVERAYREATSKNVSLGQHITSQIKRHEPTIMKQVKRYNDLREKLQKLKAAHRAPPKSIIPPAINKEGLFNLDVDDTIWQDFDYTDGDLPDWLASEPTRQGINSMLVIDRCDEELSRLHSERSILQNWMQEEWAALIALEKETDDAPMAHHLTKYKQTLIAQACYW